ncbi:MAG: helix-turn-helix transcriptional regulator [Candidatus Dormibacteraeota bacterium]|uniref:Helix-turn-helix transcriptional regulator n=1 Tax=Candidatus Amunia macphersoniae TaxID=3127014 RepID=A0A934KN47_9BACT|nr:helix-turn-helix transcriptional regulator [Candidatus Dormibacteraeota bacterium]
MRRDQATWPEAGPTGWDIERHHLRHVLRAAGAHHRGRGRGGPRGFGGPGGFPIGGGFPGGRDFPWGGGRHRAGRGDIRAAILALLVEEPMHGYQIIQELDRRTEGRWRPSPGSVYPTLQQLEDEGKVRSVELEAGRRVFELSDSGREEATASTGAPPWAEAAEADSDPGSMRELFFQVGAATWQVTHAGTAKQVTQASDILRDARKRLYQLLAEESE